MAPHSGSQKGVFRQPLRIDLYLFGSYNLDIEYIYVRQGVPSTRCSLGKLIVRRVGMAKKSGKQEAGASVAASSVSMAKSDKEHLTAIAKAHGLILPRSSVRLPVSASSGK